MPPVHGPEPGASGRVLVADDQPDVLRAARLLLKVHGYAVTTVSSPAAVLAEVGRCGAADFDLLLMDLNYARDTTSGQEGLELVARVPTDVGQRVALVASRVTGGTLTDVVASTLLIEAQRRFQVLCALDVEARLELVTEELLSLIRHLKPRKPDALLN